MSADKKAAQRVLTPMVDAENSRWRRLSKEERAWARSSRAEETERARRADLWLSNWEEGLG